MKIDLMLFLVQKDFGHQVAMQVARNMVVFLKRTGGQSQYSEVLRNQAGQSSFLTELIPWIINNIEKDLRVDVLATRCNMTTRSFVRQFPKITGKTPAKFVESMRIEACKSMLEQASDKSIDEIATLVGFGSGESLRRSFLRVTGVSPSHYQRSFRASE